MRKKRELDRFAKYCFGVMGLPPIKIHYCPAKSLIDPNGNLCFGCYTYDDSKELHTKEIWLSYRMTKWNNLWNLAHEIYHYKQDRDGRINAMPLEECESEAEKASGELTAFWLIRGGKVTVDDRKN